MKKRIAILGSTGSIGRQTLDVIAANPDLFEAYSLSANTSVDLLIEQARQFMPKSVCIADTTLYAKLKAALADLPIEVMCGSEALCEMVQAEDIDVVLAAMVGYAGLRPTMAAIRANKDIALANKETLVVAGELVCSLAKEHNVRLLPVDSEHSAIFQSLVGEENNEIEKIMLTASGGPFRTMSVEELRNVTSAQALKHPNWQMGAKITIDSATMMNKGFEVIEAKWLFGVPVEKIQVVVHPESIVHSAVQFADGSIKAQLGMPDMRLPIQYALTYPHRIYSDFPRVDLFKLSALNFEQPHPDKFRCLQLAYEAMKKGGNMPCILNAANEVVNKAFIEGRIGFLNMPEMIEKAMQTVAFIAKPTYEDYVNTDKQTRLFTESLI